MSSVSCLECTNHSGFCVLSWLHQSQWVLSLVLTAPITVGSLLSAPITMGSVSCLDCTNHNGFFLVLTAPVTVGYVSCFGLHQPQWVALSLLPPPPQRGAADVEIKVPSDENTELKRSPFKAWSKLRLRPGISSLLISTLPVHSPAFFPKTSPDFFMCWLWLTLVPV